jgi:nucleoside-diphosphate-sugar epimerase
MGGTSQEEPTMRVFVTGATGFIGAAVVRELIGAGHQVLGLARSDAAARSLLAVGAEAHRGTLHDVESLQRGAAGCEGVIHTAFIHDFSNMAAATEVDRLAIEAIGCAIAGTNRPFVVSSTLALLAQGGVCTEESALDFSSVDAHRIASENAALSFGSRSVRVSVVRLPPSVHGDGDRAFVAALIRIAREQGVSAYLGEGRNRWPSVHRLDAAQLFRLALERAAAGSRFHCVADQGVPTRGIADVIGRRLNVPVVSIALEQATAHFGWLGRFFALDVPASSARTQARLRWRPRRPGLLSDLELDHYFET